MTEPIIALFICKNARTALASPYGMEQTPPGVEVIELPCSGRVDEVMVLKALRQGAWAAMVVACLDGNCKYRIGSYQARRRVDEVRSLLAQLGLEKERARFFSVASNQHAWLAEAVQRTKEAARAWGPIRILEGDG
ncbi:MAG: hydrogenase iron-sulfur subunit [Methanomassiliicoccus sp.]|nr:hydrogenase iron-sulfur subunit [Methanomassiliicoccus sp.]